MALLLVCKKSLLFSVPPAFSPSPQWSCSSQQHKREAVFVPQAGCGGCAGLLCRAQAVLWAGLTPVMFPDDLTRHRVLGIVQGQVSAQTKFLCLG